MYFETCKHFTWDSKMLDKNNVYTFNDVMYGYRGSIKDDSVILKAEPNYSHSNEWLFSCIKLESF